MSNGCEVVVGTFKSSLSPAATPGMEDRTNVQDAFVVVPKGVGAPTAAQFGRVETSTVVSMQDQNVPAECERSGGSAGIHIGLPPVQRGGLDVVVSDSYDDSLA